MTPLIITAALTGAEVTRAQQPALPLTPQEIGIAAAECAQAGASIVHVHGRLADGAPTQDKEVYRQIIAEQMLKIHDAGYRIVTMTHDEIVIIAKKKDAKKALDFMIQVMSTPPDWAPGLPLAAEGDFDDCYSK